jgi:hypothetical protein
LKLRVEDKIKYINKKHTSDIGMTYNKLYTITEIDVVVNNIIGFFIKDDVNDVHLWTYDNFNKYFVKINNLSDKIKVIRKLLDAKTR